jgi:hypothetical protein
LGPKARPGSQQIDVVFCYWRIELPSPLPQLDELASDRIFAFPFPISFGSHLILPQKDENSLSPLITNDGTGMRLARIRTPHAAGTRIRQAGMYAGFYFILAWEKPD